MAESKTIVRSRYNGLRDIYVAKVLENTDTTYKADKPVKIGRAISGTVNDTFTSEKLISDDGVEGVVSSYTGTEVELGVNALAPADRQAVFGQFYSNGFLIKSAEDEAPEVALGFRARRLNGKYDFVWLYCGSFAQGNEETYETKTPGSTTTQTATLRGSFYERQKEDVQDGKKVHRYECLVDESNLAADETEAAAAIAAWFDAVQEYKEHAAG